MINYTVTIKDYSHKGLVSDVALRSALLLVYATANYKITKTSHKGLVFHIALHSVKYLFIKPQELKLLGHKVFTAAYNKH